MPVRTDRLNVASPVMTVREVADLLRINRTTVYRLLKSGLLPGFRIGSDRRFDRGSIDRWRDRRDL